jgi:hypothetical protein
MRIIHVLHTNLHIISKLDVASTENSERRIDRDLSADMR